MKALDEYYDKQEPKTQGILLALRHFFLSYSNEMTEAKKYGLPFFLYSGKAVCYLWKDKKTQVPYIGWVDGQAIDHPMLISGNRKRMSVQSIPFNEDIPVGSITEILVEAIKLVLPKKGVF